MPVPVSGFRHPLAVAFIGILNAAAPSAAAQTANVIEAADDAFGTRIGTETLGLYSEALVRGFNLQDSGSFLLGDAYYARAGGLTDAVLSSTAIRVGPNALDFDYPAPSGVVQYQLLGDAVARTQWQVGFADLAESQLRPYGRLYATRMSDGGRASVAGGLVAYPRETYADGSSGEFYSAGLVPRWRPSDAWSITGLVHATRWRRQGDLGFAPAGEQALPRIARRRYYGQDWAYTTSEDENLGLIVRHALSPALMLQASSIVSSGEDPESAFHLFTDVDARGEGQGTVIRGRGRRALARAHELRAEREWRGVNALTRLDVGVRARASDFVNPVTAVIPVGPVRFPDGIPVLPDPGLPPAADGGANAVDQIEPGFSLQHRRRSGVALSTSLRRTRLEQTNRPSGGNAVTSTDEQWLYTASAVLPLSPAWTAFAATTRGIEESGAAPLNAANRFEILPPALSRQSEVGVKWQGEGLALIATAFDLSRSNAGFDAAQRFGYVGTVRHRGLEVSLAGKVDDAWTVVLGALAMRPRIEGEPVDAGRLGDRPVGRSARIAVANLNYQHPGAAWSYDVTWNYNGPRPADPLSRTETPGFSNAAVGARLRFDWAGQPAVVRLRIGNVTDKDAWFAGGSGLQLYTAPRRVDLSLTVGG
jgi:iron complex outermembrane receptor protein